MTKTGRPPKDTTREIIEREKPWERYGVCRATWYAWRHVLRTTAKGQPVEGHLEIIRLKRLRKNNQSEARKIEKQMRDLNINIK